MAITISAAHNLAIIRSGSFYVCVKYKEKIKRFREKENKNIWIDLMDNS